MEITDLSRGGRAGADLRRRAHRLLDQGPAAGLGLGQGVDQPPGAGHVDRPGQGLGVERHFGILLAPVFDEGDLQPAQRGLNRRGEGWRRSLGIWRRREFIGPAQAGEAQQQAQDQQIQQYRVQTMMVH